jgi:hypothetical protein
MNLASRLFEGLHCLHHEANLVHYDIKVRTDALAALQPLCRLPCSST